LYFILCVKYFYTDGGGEPVVINTRTARYALCVVANPQAWTLAFKTA
jgi:hypothetical protein